MALGAGDVVSMQLTWSWGSSPASATITLPGEDTSFGAGDEIALNIGSRTFHGVVSSSAVTQTGLNGKGTVLTVLDNRSRMAEDLVCASFNNLEIREDNPATPGIDRQKRYWHVLPADWDKQKRTYATKPLTAKEIITHCLGADTIRFNWTSTTHAAHSAAIDCVDAMNGGSLQSILQQICEQLGLVYSVEGYNTIIWARKGEGTVPNVPPSQRPEYTIGEAMSHVSPRVRVIGERGLFQDMPITLEPWWVREYEQYLLEADWLDAVNANFGPFAKDETGEALKAAKARVVTVREFAAKKGTQFADYGMWGEVSRMEIPVYVYLRDIVLKAYRVPRGYKLRGLAVDSLTMHEGLLVAVDYAVDSGLLSAKSPRELYPADKAFVVVKGQQLDLVDPRGQKVITEDAVSSARTKWTPNNKFSVDTRPDCLGVIFEEQTFIPGEGKAGLFIFPNRGKEGITKEHPLYNIAVPNAAVTFAPADVKASFTWEAEKFAKYFGSGTRTTAHYVSGLQYHALCNSGVFSEEIKYIDGEGAEEKAQAYANSLVLRQAVYQTGRMKRVGSAGTALNGVIDRVTITLDGNGISEEIEFTKERASRGFFSERMLDRQARTQDLFPGQKAVQNEVFLLTARAAVTKDLKRTPQVDRFKSIPDVMQKPLGAIHCNPVPVVSEKTVSAGTCLFRDTKTGKVDAKGKMFAGVVVADGAKGNVMCATAGEVPVQVKGPFRTGDWVGVNEEEAFAVTNGARLVGVVNATYDKTDTVTAPVRLVGIAQQMRLPFEIYPVKDGKVKVAKHSLLMNDLAVDEDLDIEKLDEAQEPIEDAWVWIEVTIEDEKATKAELKWGAEGETEWEEYPKIYKLEEGDQTTAYIPIAYFAKVPKNEANMPGPRIRTSKSELQIVQLARTHLLLTRMCVEDDTSVVYAIPAIGGKLGDLEEEEA